MAGVLIRLKLALLGNAFRRSIWQVVGIVLACVYGLGLMLTELASLPLLARQDAEFIESAWVVAGGLLVLGWAVVPIISMGADMTLDPRRFSPFAISPAKLMPGLAVATLVGVPGVVTVVLAVGNAWIWKERPAMVPVAVLSAIAGVIVCVIASRACTVVLGRLLASRNAKWLLMAGIAVPVVLMVVLVLSASTTSAVRLDADQIPGIANVLAWTPVGAPWGVTVAVARGEWWIATGQALVTVASVIVLTWWWHRGLRVTMETPVSDRRPRRSGDGLGMFSLAQGPLSAMTARSLVYWFRDARYAAGLAVVPVLPFVFFLFTGGRGVGMLALGPTVAFLLAWSISVDVAYDGRAFWTQLALGVTGRVDRAGRALAVLLLTVPLAGMCVLGSLWATGRWEAAAATTGMTVGVLLVSLGLSSVLSVLFIYPVPGAGENPFSAPSGSSAINLLTQVVGWLLLVLCAAPVLISGVLAVRWESEVMGLLCLAVGLVGGGLLLWGGIVLGGRRLDSHGPDLFAQLTAIR